MRAVKVTLLPAGVPVTLIVTPSSASASRGERGLIAECGISGRLPCRRRMLATSAVLAACCSGETFVHSPSTQEVA
jgi:hypothetical protein